MTRPSFQFHTNSNSRPFLVHFVSPLTAFEVVIIVVAMSTPSTKIENINQAINLIEKTNINDVIRGLNYLLQKSYEANEITSGSTVIYIEQYPHLLTKLGNLLDVINPSGKLPFEKSLKSQEENYYSFLFGDVAVSSSSGNDSSSSSSNIEWSVELPGADSTFFKVSKLSIAPLSNMSFDWFLCL